MRYAIIESGTVENVIVADEAFAVHLRAQGRVVIGPLAARTAVAPGYSYDGRDFSPGVKEEPALDPRTLTDALGAVELPKGDTDAEMLDVVRGWVSQLRDRKESE